ncbi:MAG: hypothetical protein WCQ95_00085 [Bacteroidota bacterium]
MIKHAIEFSAKYLLLLLSFVLFILNANAHEEPTKTLKEKEDKIKKEKQIQKSKIKTTIVYKLVYDNDTLSPVKHKVFRMGYDKNGSFSFIEAYEKDSLTEKDEYTYSINGDMISENDFALDNKIIEKNVFIFDKDGRLISGISKNKNDSLTGYFKIIQNSDKKSLEFLSYATSDSLKYKLVYNYTGDFDSNDYIEALKYDAKGKLTMKVEKEYDTKSQQTRKTIFDDQGKRLYSFLYEYDSKGNNINITKKHADGSMDWKDIYVYDKNGNCNRLKRYDKNNTLKMQLVYEFDFYK